MSEKAHWVCIIKPTS